MFKGFRWYDWMFGLMTYGLWIVFKILKNKWKEKASPSQLTSTDAVNNDGVSELPNNMESNETLSPKTSTDAVNNDGVSELPNNMESNETLSPKTALAAALVYTVGADGVLSPEETIFLEGALKGDTSLFNKGAEYTNKNSKDTFISEASELLNKDQKMCVIINVTDCMVADGNIADEEASLLYEFFEGFGVAKEKTKPIIEFLAAKNISNNMGSNETLSPKTALAAALTYMVAADGVLSPEEETYLGGALKGDQSALKKGVEYAQKNSKDTFISEASELLNEGQKMCVIMNLAECSASESSAADEEVALLFEFLVGFGVATEKLKPILEFLSTKNCIS